MAGSVSFFLNGARVTIDDPPPDLLLIDYLRSPEVGLAGPKKGCGQGGCGACTVILSSWDPAAKEARHRAINSCLRPVCALGGLAVTTVEGTGEAIRPPAENPAHILVHGRSAAVLDRPTPQAEKAQRRARRFRQDLRREQRRYEAEYKQFLDRLTDEEPVSRCTHSHDDDYRAMNPVAYELAANNGSQCGYCSVGFVMTMSAFLANNPTPTKREIEDAFDGNLCRCTGYRAILTGMKTFASDWSPEDEKNRMKCVLDDGCIAQRRTGQIGIPFPKEAHGPGLPVTASGGGQDWLTPTSMRELVSLIQRFGRGRQRKNLRLVHGNTSYGIYKEEFGDVDLFVDIRLIPELYGHNASRGAGVGFGAAVDYTELIGILEGAMEDGASLRDAPPLRVDGSGRARAMRFSRLGAAHFMCRRTAGHIVRDAASVGGNTMLVLKHIGDGEPFPSDLFTALVAIDAEIEFVRASSRRKLRWPVERLVAEIAKQYEPGARRPRGPRLEDDIVLVRYHLPRGSEREVVLPQKVALREVNAHSIVNATTRVRLSDDLVAEEAVLVFGGIAPYPWRPMKTEQAMLGQPLSLDGFPALAAVLEEEVARELARWRRRMRKYPSEGFTEQYKVDLATSFLYKAVVNALLQRGAGKVPHRIRSCGDVQWGRWPVSDGRQYYKNQAFKRPVSQPYIKLMAMYQTSGQVHYTHELELPPLAVNAAFVQSTRALADYHFKIPGKRGPVEPGKLREYLEERFGPSVGLITYEDIPETGINKQGMGADQPLFARDRVSYVGQSLALVIAEVEQEAIEIAAWVSANCVGYSDIRWPKPFDKPILSIADAIRANSIFPDQPASAPFASHIWRITRPGSRFDWVVEDDAANTRALEQVMEVRDARVDNIPCNVVESSQTVGGQVHFYMETQACVAEPADGERLIIHPSSQSPGEMRAVASLALGVEYNRIDINVRQLGGGYGGKTEQAKFVTGAAAVAAHKLDKTVRLAMPREEDTAMIGKRHPYYGHYQIAIDRGETRRADRGLIHGLQTRMWGDGGAFYDCSFIVSNCIQLRADSAYRVRNFQNQIDVCRTNTAPNTAFRAFGDVQCKLILENAIDDAAFTIGMAAEDVREKNMYERGDVTPFGQALSYCYMKDVWSFLKSQCRYQAKRDQIEAFNNRNRWRKRGLAMIPVKYGSGYNLKLLEQAAAVVSVFASDGTIVVEQGGVDMGQGMMTKLEQVASYVLNVPMGMIQVKGPQGTVIPNPTSTGGSTGTAYNGEAVKRTCEDLRERLTEFGYQKLKEKGEVWCAQQGIDFWSHPKGWATKVPKPNGPANLIWQNLVQLAYQERVSLVSSFNAPIPGGEVPIPAMEYKPRDQQPKIPGVPISSETTVGGAVDSFVGFTFSAACSVVELDILTGEVKILSSDIVYDMGWSLNPAIDIGQVEGAFMQGVGYLLTEKLQLQPFDSGSYKKGRLNTLNTWRYKLPATTTVPLEMNTFLFPRDRSSVPENPDLLFSSKEVGEPPLVLSISVFFALKAAIRASRLERGLSGLFRLDAPATVQEVRRACEVSTDELGGGGSRPAAKGDPT